MLHLWPVGGTLGRTQGFRGQKSRTDGPAETVYAILRRFKWPKFPFLTISGTKNPRQYWVSTDFVRKIRLETVSGYHYKGRLSRFAPIASRRSDAACMLGWPIRAVIKRNPPGQFPAFPAKTTAPRKNIQTPKRYGYKKFLYNFFLYV